MTLWAGRADVRSWVVFGAGVVAYTSGHGIHLAANSIGNQDPGQTAHLWDEAVGHLVSFVGVALVLAALALTMIGKPRPHAVGYVLAAAAGLTWASNAIGGGTLLLSLAVAIAAAAFDWRRRGEMGVVLLVGYLPAVLVIGTEPAGPAQRPRSDPDPVRPRCAPRCPCCGCRSCCPATPAGRTSGRPRAPSSG